MLRTSCKLSRVLVCVFMAVTYLSINPASAQEQEEPIAQSTAADEVSAVAQDTAAETKKTTDELEAERMRKLPIDERFKQLISLDLRNIDILDAFKFIANKAQINIITTKNVGGRVTVTLNNVAMQDIFDFMLRSNALAYVKKGEVYEVMSEPEYRAYYGKNFFDMRIVKIFRLKYAIPEKAFTLIDTLKSEIGRVLVDTESGNVMIMDTPEAIKLIEKSLLEFERENLVEVFILRYANAPDVEELLKARLDTKNVGSIFADERNNQVIVQTFPDRMEEIRELIRILDKPTKEVLIDAKIVKVKLSDQLDSGMEWEGILNVAKKDSKAYIGTTPFSYMTAGSASPAFKSRTTWLSEKGGEINSIPFSSTTSSLNLATKLAPGEGLHFGVLKESQDIDSLFEFLNTIGKTRVLANPKIVVVNKQEAKIHVGERQAYVTTTTNTGQTTSTIAEEVTFVDVGIQLSVTPTINEDGFILLKVKPEISSVSGTLETPTGNQIPIIDTSLTETTVLMKDQTTLLIGGLRKEEKTKSSQGLPFLGKLPLVGRWLQSGTEKTERTELMVLITPHIIDGSELIVKDMRESGEKTGKEFIDYAPLPDKTLLQQTAPESVGMKTYSEYTDFMDFKNKGDERLEPIKGQIYNPK